MAAPATGPAIPSTGGLPPPHARSSSAPPAATATSPTTIEHVAECTYEFLLAEILQWVERDEKRIAEEARRLHLAAQDGGGSGGGGGGGDGSGYGADGEGGAAAASDASKSTNDEAAAAVMAAERSAARIERMGYDVGYRLCERLAQHRPLLGPGSPSPESGSADNAPSSNAAVNTGGVGSNPIIMGGGGHHTVMDPKTQLEAVKFLCKEFWTEVFRKQIDKLQTNHRGVFVLKDQELKWLRRLPPDEESARVGAIRILAFPCGLIRGALACLGLSGAVVSCDFLADGRTMASCSFNIKVK
ncbi:hypothetical protein ACHAXR_012273 [Thalassiosira sp. AJA248-18]